MFEMISQVSSWTSYSEIVRKGSVLVNFECWNNRCFFLLLVPVFHICIMNIYYLYNGELLIYILVLFNKQKLNTRKQNLRSATKKLKEKEKSRGKQMQKKCVYNLKQGSRVDIKVEGIKVSMSVLLAFLLTYILPEIFDRNTCTKNDIFLLSFLS